MKPVQYCTGVIFEPVHEISNNVVFATSEASDQPAYNAYPSREHGTFKISHIVTYGVDNVWCL